VLSRIIEMASLHPAELIVFVSEDASDYERSEIEQHLTCSPFFSSVRPYERGEVYDSVRASFADNPLASQVLSPLSMPGGFLCCLKHKAPRRELAKELSLLRAMPGIKAAGFKRKRTS
jgi:hypothetical protein